MYGDCIGLRNEPMASHPPALGRTGDGGIWITGPVPGPTNKEEGALKRGTFSCSADG